MPQTPILALPYPAPTDPADVPTDMGELSNRVEAVRGAINGLASLGADGKVPATQLPPVSYGTSLPASPIDGQEAILVDSVTNPSYQWRFRYNLGSTSPHKWECIGGGWAHANDGTSLSVTTVYTTWQDGVPAIVVPRAGQYTVLFSAVASNNTLNNGAMLNVRADPSPPSDANLVFTRMAAVDSYQALTRNCELDVAAAGNTIRMIYAAFIGGIASFDRRVLQLLPRRVS